VQGVREKGNQEDSQLSEIEIRSPSMDADYHECRLGIQGRKKDNEFDFELGKFEQIPAVYCGVHIE
jgi:hypothetical protein